MATMLRFKESRGSATKPLLNIMIVPELITREWWQRQMVRIKKIIMASNSFEELILYPTAIAHQPPLSKGYLVKRLSHCAEYHICFTHHQLAPKYSMKA
jgi:hypothetical protein